MRKQILLGGYALILLGVLGSGTAHAQVNGDSSVTQRPNGSIEARVSLDRTQYPSNRAVAVNMTVTNIGRQNQTITVGRNYSYDYSIRDSRTQRVVYQMSRHRQPSGGNFTLRPGDVRTYRELWDQRDDSGKPVGAGVYVIEARIMPQGAVSTQFFLTGQGGGRPDQDPQPGPGDPGQPNPPGTPNNGLRGLLSTDTTRVQTGQTVRFTYTVDNQTRETMRLAFASGKQFDMAITGPQGRVVWTASQGMSYIQSLTQFELRPTERKVFQQRWTVPSNLAPGTYRVTAYLTPQRNPSGVGTAVTTIVVGGYNGPIRRGDEGREGGSARVVGLRDLVNDGIRSVGKRVTVSGIYMGLRGGDGAPPVRRSDWVLASEGVSLYVSGPDQGVQPGGNVTVTATVRRTNDGRLYLDML